MQEVFPGCCIHFEDWKGTDALRLLAKYTRQGLLLQRRHPGDRQRHAWRASSARCGSRAPSSRISGPLPRRRARPAIGIADTDRVRDAARGAQARARRAIASRCSTSTASSSRRARTSIRDQQRYAHRARALARTSSRPSRPLKPTAIIGVSTKAKAFTRQVIEAMTPAQRAADRLRAVESHRPRRVHAARGVRVVRRAGPSMPRACQFPPVALGGKTFYPSQANNFYIFPAVGLAVYATRAKRVTDEMFIEAARATADQVDRRRSASRGCSSRRRATSSETEVAHRGARGEARLRPQPRPGRSAEGHPAPGSSACSTSPNTRRSSHAMPSRSTAAARTRAHRHAARRARAPRATRWARSTVPADHYWGAQTQRSLIHFSIGDDRMPKAVYHAYGYVKKAAALINAAGGPAAGVEGRRRSAPRPTR